MAEMALESLLHYGTISNPESGELEPTILLYSIHQSEDRMSGLAQRIQLRPGKDLPNLIPAVLLRVEIDHNHDDTKDPSLILVGEDASQLPLVNVAERGKWTKMAGESGDVRIIMGIRPWSRSIGSISELVLYLDAHEVVSAKGRAEAWTVNLPYVRP